MKEQRAERPGATDTGQAWRLPGAPGGEARLRVAFVVHAMQVAGAEMLVAETARRLAGVVEPTVLCLDAVGQLGEELRSEGVEVVCLGRHPGIDLVLPWRMARQVRRRRIGIIHAHQYTPFFYAALARLLLGGSPRLVLTEHGRHYPDVVSPRRRLTNRLLLGRLASAVNACSGFSRKALIELDGFSPERVEVIANGVRAENYAPASDRSQALAALGLDPTRRYLAMIGRLHPIKDHDTLLRAFRIIADTHQDTDLLLVGDGPLRSELEDRVRELDLAGRVRFLGVRHDVPAILAILEVFLLTSLSEAASLTLLEAMASSLPVVVTDVGGNREIVRHGREGFLAPRGDAQAIAQATSRLLGDPALARELGRAARERVTREFLLDTTIASYLDLYRRLARGSASAGTSSLAA